MLYSGNGLQLLSRSSAKTNSESYRGPTTEQLTELASFAEKQAKFLRRKLLHALQPELLPAS